MGINENTVIRKLPLNWLLWVILLFVFIYMEEKVEAEVVHGTGLLPSNRDELWTHAFLL